MIVLAVPLQLDALGFHQADQGHLSFQPFDLLVRDTCHCYRSDKKLLITFA
jgi:hypothetical protein